MPRPRLALALWLLVATIHGKRAPPSSSSSRSLAGDFGALWSAVAARRHPATTILPISASSWEAAASPSSIPAAQCASAARCWQRSRERTAKAHLLCHQYSRACRSPARRSRLQGWSHASFIGHAALPEAIARSRLYFADSITPRTLTHPRWPRTRPYLHRSARAGQFELDLGDRPLQLRAWPTAHQLATGDRAVDESSPHPG